MDSLRPVELTEQAEGVDCCRVAETATPITEGKVEKGSVKRVVDLGHQAALVLVDSAAGAAIVRRLARVVGTAEAAVVAAIKG